MDVNKFLKPNGILKTISKGIMHDLSLKALHKRKTLTIKRLLSPLLTNDGFEIFVGLIAH